MSVIQTFVSARDWQITRQILEAHQALLFRPEVAAIFEQSIAQTRAEGQPEFADMLAMHLALLQECQAHGIAATFARLAASQAARGEDNPDPEG